MAADARAKIRAMLRELAEHVPTKDPVKLGRALPSLDSPTATIDWKNGIYVVRFVETRSMEVIVEATVHEWAHARVGDRFKGSCYRQALHDDHWSLEYGKAYRVIYATT